MSVPEIDDINSILRSFRPGETVLVEHTPASSPELLLYLVVSRALEDKVPVLIDDIADTFSQYVKRLEVKGLNVESLLKVPVIKMGGRIETGNVIGGFDIEKYVRDFNPYWDIFDSHMPEETACNPVLGVYKVISALEEREVRRLIRSIGGETGNKRRFALYFVNEPLLRETVPEALPLLEEMATTIVKWESEGGLYRLRVEKSANPEIEGTSVTIKLQELLKELL